MAETPKSKMEHARCGRAFRWLQQHSVDDPRDGLQK